MVQESVFRGVISFFDQIGVYDIILPFLLVFTIVFAILEKTKVLGLEEIDGKKTTKKNLNAMLAFVTAFLVIASTQLVAIINQVMANIVLLMILAVSFLLLVGVFFGDKEFTLQGFEGWTSFFMVAMFLGVVVIFLNALDWLEPIFNLFRNWNTEWAATIIFMIIIVGSIWFVIYEPKPAKSESKEKK